MSTGWQSWHRPPMSELELQYIPRVMDGQLLSKLKWIFVFALILLVLSFHGIALWALYNYPSKDHDENYDNKHTMSRKMKRD